MDALDTTERKKNCITIYVRVLCCMYITRIKIQAMEVLLLLLLLSYQNETKRKYSVEILTNTHTHTHAHSAKLFVCFHSEICIVLQIDIADADGCVLSVMNKMTTTTTTTTTRIIAAPPPLHTHTQQKNIDSINVFVHR